FLNVNKPPGLTSFDVIRELRKQLKVKKMGHLGTLDPMATGVLPVAIGNATRLISFLDEANKCYRSRGRLGATSDTQDQSGTITVIKQNPKLSHNQLSLQLQQMTGIIMQHPPMYSAVHHEGRRLYELAREGITVDVPARPVNIYRLELIDMGEDEHGQWVDLEIECSRGTYIRTLWHDLGQALECGAYMEQLERTKAGQFTISEAIPLANCSAQGVLPPDFPFRDWGEVMVNGAIKNRISNGNPVMVPSTMELGKIIIKNVEGNLLALGEITSNLASECILKPWRVIPFDNKG
ncbi:MAG: tRNA pseudouridine(55) synthase TruB, partial [Methylocystaceae bacterium]